ncbi:protein LOW PHOTOSYNTHETIC EFFICIENCY 1, chloroplastic [Nymphaea colorata]|uniref:protein LOW PHOTOSYNTHETIC EFFICIENCY 1, chloroplastic n=1 Tax=Nymphaea colorata TaxID=210225 RepID=UPI00129E1C95|nr:protein LOW PHOTOSYNTHETIC EFFICIENCY 1, chloroplastic [Nymphaea colorata]
MQTMSVFPSNLEYLDAPKSQCEHSGSCIPRRRRRQLVFGASVRCNSYRDCFPSNGFSLSSSFGNPRVYQCMQCHSRAWLEQEPSVCEQIDDEKDDVCSKAVDWKLDSVVGTESEDGYEGKSENNVSSNTEGGNRGFVNRRSSRIDVRALAQRLKFSEGVEDVEKVLKGMELPPPVYCSMIRGFGIDRRLSPAFALVEWLKKKKEAGRADVLNIYIYNSLLGAVKASEQFGETRRVLNDMEEQGILPNIVAYNTLMAIYLEQGMIREALNIFEEIPSKGLSPSSVSYSTVLLAYRKMEDASGAVRFFGGIQEMYRDGEFGRDSTEDWEREFHKIKNFTIKICYQVMRTLLVSGENVTLDILKLFNDMDKTGLQFSRAEYERLVWACTSEDHFSVAKEVYTRIRESGPEISLSVCNHVIWLMGKAKKWWAALEIYEELLDKGPKPNNLSYELIVSHFNVLLTAAKKRGIWKWAVRLIEKMQDKGLKPSSREWNSVLIACARASEASVAVQIFMRMVEQGEKPTIHSYGALLSALEKAKMYDKAITVWQHMYKVNVQPNLYAYTTMALIYIGNGNYKNVDALVQEMVSRGIEPSVVTFNAIISGCARNGLGSVAFEWFHHMEVRGVAPNEITYEMLIEALAKDGKPRLAYDVYLRARNEGKILSSKAYDAILMSSQTYNASIDASLLGPRPPGRRVDGKTSSELFGVEDAARRG